MNRENLLSTSKIGQKLGVQINAETISKICPPVFKTGLGVYWAQEQLPIIAIGLSAKFSVIAFKLLKEKQ